MAVSIIDRLTTPERELVKCARPFARQIVEPQVLEAEGHGRFPKQTYEEGAALGLTAIQVPVAHGGLGFGYRCKMAVAEEISHVSMAYAFSLINTHNVAAKLGNDASQIAGDYVPSLLSAQTFGATALTEPQAGSDFSAIGTTAVKCDGGWRLSGEKAWITNAAFADLFVTYAQTDASAGWRGIACYLVRASEPGFERAEAFSLVGANSIGTGGFTLTDHFVPDSHVVHPPGEAFKAALGSINGARTYVAAMCCALVASALDKTIAYTRERQTFGKPLLDRQGLRWRLADIATDLEAGRALTYHAAELVEAGSSDAVAAAAHAKKFCARMAPGHISACIQTMGAHGLLSSHLLGQHLACAKLSGFVDGSTEIQNERLAALLLD
jgi:alkylation response protein AidB-like acyl-CoA dehydrogenase